MRAGPSVQPDDVIIATHKTIDLVFRTQVYQLKRAMPVRSRSSALAVSPS